MTSTSAPNCRMRMWALSSSPVSNGVRLAVGVGVGVVRDPISASPRRQAYEIGGQVSGQGGRRRPPVGGEVNVGGHPQTHSDRAA
jgi:hypothetical protein